MGRLGRDGDDVDHFTGLLRGGEDGSENPDGKTRFGGCKRNINDLRFAGRILQY